MRGSIDPGPDLVRGELHRAPGERRIAPVVTSIEQRAERPDVVSEFENPVRDALRGSRDHKAVKIAMHWIKSYRDLDFRSLGSYTRADLDAIAAAPDAF